MGQEPSKERGLDASNSDAFQELIDSAAHGIEVESIDRALDQLNPDELERLYRFLRTQGPDKSKSPQFAELLSGIRDRLGEIRVEEVRAAALDSTNGGLEEYDEPLSQTGSPTAPLRRRLLDALRENPSTPKLLAQSLRVRSETISRNLTKLSSDGMVTFTIDEDDKRSKTYSLTDLGASRLTQSRSLARGDSATSIDAMLVNDYLASALDIAVADRRTSNKLGEAITRLDAIVGQSNDRGLETIELRARRELATTLRQDRRWAELEDQIQFFERVASGVTTNDPALALPAYAHWKYEHGRLPISGEAGLAERARSLVASADAYRDLMELSEENPARFSHDHWLLRRAWSVVSIADNLREQTQFGKAIDHARFAEFLFREASDPYGETHSLFIQGFCHRLRGQYGQATIALNQSLKLAEQHDYNRHFTNSLIQLGDVARSLKAFGEAKDLLKLAIERASSMNMDLSLAFAYSTLGAVHFHEDTLSESQSNLNKAGKLFAQVGHQQGLALNLRRMAVVVRQQSDLATAGQLAADSARRYFPLHSPAGVATAAVTIGEIEIDRGRNQEELCGNLLRFLRNRSQRRLLELDPWFPQLLNRLAMRTEHNELLVESQALIEDASATLYEDDDENLQIPGLFVASAGPTEGIRTDREVDIFHDDPDPMGGETRRNSEKIAA